MGVPVGQEGFPVKYRRKLPGKYDKTRKRSERGKIVFVIISVFFYRYRFRFFGYRYRNEIFGYGVYPYWKVPSKAANVSFNPFTSKTRTNEVCIVETTTLA